MKAIDKISVGQIFKYWTVISKNAAHPKKVMCECVCGNRLMVNVYNLMRSLSTSCGCKSRKRAQTHGLSKTPEYKTWKAIKARCYQASNKSYGRYGGKGITVCDEWISDFPQFLKDMGNKPSPNHSIGRINNKKGYTPENCRWENQKQQMRNTSRSAMVSTNHGRITIAELSEKTGIKDSTIYHRKAAGWPDEKLTVQRYGYRNEKTS